MKKMEKNNTHNNATTATTRMMRSKAAMQNGTLDNTSDAKPSLLAHSGSDTAVLLATTVTVHTTQRHIAY